MSYVHEWSDEGSATVTEIPARAKSREAGNRFLVWVGYGQYISMGTLALAGLILMAFRAAQSEGGPGRSTAVGFALLFAMIFGYSMWRLRRHHTRNRRSPGAGAS
jgi:hypothetical protein